MHLAWLLHRLCILPWTLLNDVRKGLLLFTNFCQCAFAILPSFSSQSTNPCKQYKIENIKYNIKVFPENAPAQTHNSFILKNIPNKLFSKPAKNEIPKNSSISNISEVQYRKQSETGGLVTLVELKVKARVIITPNTNISDRLINGQIRTANYIETKESEVSTIYLALDDTFSGLSRTNGNNIIGKSNRWIPTERDEISIYLSKCKTTSPTIQRTQFPLMQSWRCESTESRI